MLVRLNSQRPILFVCLVLAWFAVGTPTDAFAECPDAAKPALAHDCPESEQLCGWVERDVLEAEGLNTAVTSDDLAIDFSVTLIATAVCNRAGVSVEQIVEPFAMVGPTIEDSLDAVKQFQSWWDRAGGAEEIESVKAADRIALTFVDVNRLFDPQVMVLAALEPSSGPQCGFKPIHLDRGTS